MADERRALLTKREREILSGDADVTDNYTYSVESRVRTRLRERLKKDVDLLTTYYPEIYDELVYPAVCQPAEEEGSERAGEGKENVDGNVSNNVDDTGKARERAGEGTGESVDEAVHEAVERVAQNWEDTDKRLNTRKSAAAAVLEHALRTDDAVGKSSEIVSNIRATHPVEGQKAETYWRKNIRPVLKEYGQYSQAQHGYKVEGLE